MLHCCTVSVSVPLVKHCFVSTMASTRSKIEVYLLGSIEQSITGSKLPSKKQVLQVFLYHHMEQKKTKSDAAMETMKLVEDFWERAQIPTQKPQRVKKI